jgi:hypothetical protein
MLHRVQSASPDATRRRHTTDRKRVDSHERQRGGQGRAEERAGVLFGHDEVVRGRD